MELALADAGGRRPTRSATSTPTAPRPRSTTWPRPRPSPRSSASPAPPVTSTKGITGHAPRRGRRHRGRGHRAQHRARGSSRRPPATSSPTPRSTSTSSHGAARPWDPAPVLSNSFGFGGHNGCLVIGPPSRTDPVDPAADRPHRDPRGARYGRHDDHSRRRAGRGGRSGPADLAIGAFSPHPPWIVDLDRPVLDAPGIDALRARTRAEAPALTRRRRLPPGSRVVAGRRRPRHGPGAAGTSATPRGTPTSRAGLSRRLRRAFERLGPTYIKLGQILSSGEGIFPEELVDGVPAAAATGSRPSPSPWSAASSRRTSAVRSTERVHLVRPDAHRLGLDRPGPRGARCGPASGWWSRSSGPTWPRWSAGTSPP